MHIVYTSATVVRAIAVHGCQLSDKGEITPALRARLDKAIQLYDAGLAPAIIVCGWRPLKREDLGAYCEADVMEEYIRAKRIREGKSAILVLKERNSTSVPENLVFVRKQFPKLRVIHIVVGEKVVKRIAYFAYMVFKGNAKFSVHGCNDGVGTQEQEEKLIADAKCTLKKMIPGRWRYLFAGYKDGRPQSHWDKLRIAHHKCPYYNGQHPR